MTRADEHAEIYREQVVALRRAQAAGEGASFAQPLASFSVGFLYGAGFPQSAATMAELYRLAHPGAPFIVLWPGEA
jgi:hypothetical protein